MGGTGNLLRLGVQESRESGTNDNGFIVDNFAVDAATDDRGTAAPIPTPSESFLAALCALLAIGAVVIRKRRT